MVVSQPDTSGIKVHLSFEVYFDFMELDSEVVEREKVLNALANTVDGNGNVAKTDGKSIAKQKRENWQRWIQFIITNKVVKAWDVLDADGNPLDPSNAESYKKLSMFDFARVRLAIALHNKGIVDSAKN